MDTSLDQKANKIFNMALEVYFGIDRPKNIIQTQKFLQESADLGLTKSMNLLGDLYIKGILPSDEFKEGIEMYERGCKAGDNRSFPRLARCYEKGIGVKTDLKKAFDLYMQAYDLGNTGECFDIARCYNNGIGVERSQSKAISWYQKGAEYGDADCVCNLAHCYYKGIGIEKDVDKARELFLSVSEHNALIQKNLGVIYYKGTKQNAPDEEQAIHWFSVAAENGNVDSMIYLGNIYKGKKEIAAALKWYRRAAFLDKNKAAYIYAFHLYKYNPKEEWELAFKWMACAAENKNVEAEFMLGLFFKCGIGTPVDLIKAFYWYNLAAEHEHEQAFSHVGRYYREGALVKQDYQTALYWFEKAITSKNDNVRSEALYDYGVMFLNGYGVKKDRKKAIDFLLESKSYGCLNAIKKLNDLDVPDTEAKPTGRSSTILNGNIIDFVKMKIDDSTAETNWVPNILEKLNIHIKHTKDSGMLEESEDGSWKWTLDNISYAQWVLIVSDELQLFCLNNKNERKYYPMYFANTFLNKKGKNFKSEDLRHNMSAINNPIGCVGEKHIDKIMEIIKSARAEIKEKGL